MLTNAPAALIVAAFIATFLLTACNGYDTPTFQSPFDSYDDDTTGFYSKYDSEISRSFPSSVLGRKSRVRNPFPYTITADKQAGTLTILSSRYPYSVDTIDLGRNTEPMYLAVDIRRAQFWVADRANSRLIRFQKTVQGFKRRGSFKTANGTFHTVSTQDDRTFFPLAWTSCDIDLVTTVHLMTNGRLLATIPTPRFIQRTGGFPHDVAVSFRYGFVSYIESSTKRGYVVAYDAFNFKRLKIVGLSQDPHISIRGNSPLFVAAQGGDKTPGRVYMMSVPDLKILASDDQPAPHGIFISLDERILYITNIKNENGNAVVAYNATTLTRLDCGNINTTLADPHNVAQSYDMSTLYVTHALPNVGAVSVFKLDRGGCPVQDSLTVVKSGNLSFGIAPFAPQLTRWRYFN